MVMGYLRIYMNPDKVRLYTVHVVKASEHYFTTWNGFTWFYMTTKVNNSEFIYTCTFTGICCHGVS